MVNHYSGGQGLVDYLIDLFKRLKSGDVVEVKLKDGYQGTITTKRKVGRRTKDKYGREKLFLNSNFRGVKCLPYILFLKDNVIHLGHGNMYCLLLEITLFDSSGNIQETVCLNLSNKSTITEGCFT